MDLTQHLWIKSYPENIDWNMEIKPRPLFTLLQEAAHKYPENPAFDFLGKKYNWLEIHDLARKMAKGLQEQGVTKSHKVGIFLPNTPYFLISYFAILMTGATVVNLNPLYADEELQNLIEDSETDIAITTDLDMLYHKMEKLPSFHAVEQDCHLSLYRCSALPEKHPV